MTRTPLLAAASAAALLAGAGTASAEFTMTLLHTNDFHDRLEPISQYDGPCAAEDNAAGECFGGTARLVTAIKDARARAGENVLLVDGGDQFQGTLFYTYYKGSLTGEMMNMLGYDAMTVGNHEFDDGPEVLRGFVDAIDFPILMSNARRQPGAAAVRRHREEHCNRGRRRAHRPDWPDAAGHRRVGEPRRQRDLHRSVGGRPSRGGPPDRGGREQDRRPQPLVLPHRPVGRGEHHGPWT